MILTGNINEVTRKVTFEQASAVVAVVGDYDVNGVAFGFPASYEDDFDLSTGVKTVFYEATDGTVYNHVITDTDTDTGLPLWVFTDEINKGAAGTVKFAIVIDDVEGGTIVKRWVSLITKFEVKKSIEIDTSEQEQNEQTYSERLAYLMAQVAAMQTVINGISSGTPTAVSTVAQMTNESLIYLYTGSESGYTAGNWYYYNGSAWTSGGAYGNSAEVIAARTNAVDGTTYTDLQTRLDTENSALKGDLSAVSNEINALEDTVADMTGGLPERQRTLLISILRKGLYSIDQSANIDELEDLFFADIPATAIALNASSIALMVGGTETHALVATVTPTNSTDAVVWTTSNDTIATISDAGLVTAVAAGSAIITATAGDVSASCNVAVTADEITSISAVYTQSGTVYTTDSLDSLKDDLVVTANYSGGSSVTIESYDYTLSGTLTVGTSTITVSYGGQTDTFSVTVTELSLDSIAWEDKSYRDIFMTANTVSGGDFENGVPAGWTVNAGSPEITTEDCVSASHSLEFAGTSSTQYRLASSTLDQWSMEAGKSYYDAMKIKCTRYVQGGLGATSFNVFSGIYVNAVTDGWVTKSAVTTPSSAVTNNSGYIGSYSSANLDGYIDDIVHICMSDLFTDVPTKYEMDALYEEYCTLRNGGAN